MNKESVESFIEVVPQKELVRRSKPGSNEKRDEELVHCSRIRRYDMSGFRSLGF